MDSVQVLLETAHVGREVLHLGIDRICEVLNQSIEVFHVNLDTLESLSQDEAEVRLVLGHLDLVLHVVHVLRHQLLLDLLEAVALCQCRCRTALSGAEWPGHSRQLATGLACDVSRRLGPHAAILSINSVVTIQESLLEHATSFLLAIDAHVIRAIGIVLVRNIDGLVWALLVDLHDVLLSLLHEDAPHVPLVSQLGALFDLVGNLRVLRENLLLQELLG